MKIPHDTDKLFSIIWILAAFILVATKFIVWISS